MIMVCTPWPKCTKVDVRLCVATWSVISVAGCVFLLLA